MIAEIFESEKHFPVFFGILILILCTPFTEHNMKIKEMKYFLDEVSMKKNSINTSSTRINTARRPRKKKKGALDRVLLILAILLFVAALGFFLFTPIRNYFRSKTVTKQIIAIDNAMDEELTDFTMVVNKNDIFAKIDGEDVESFDGEGYNFDDLFDGLPNEIVLAAIGTIRIPAVEMNIPLWDDAGVIPLRYGAGMLQNTAMPAEEGNMVVLGHNMRERGSLFNRLNEMKIGDEVIITTMDKSEYVYVADRIVTPLDPENLPDYIGINSGSGKQLTLVTCTLEGGTHRLLVICHLKEESS